jgi:hypothetical protein
MRTMTFLLGLLPLIANGDDGGWLKKDRAASRPDFTAVKAEFYREACGACHFAYQPGLLPARSWQALLKGMQNHFGETIGLDPELTRKLSRYLSLNAADRSGFRRSIKIATAITGDDIPLRVSETPYFLHEHRELNRGQGDRVKLSACPDCHTRAGEGFYNEKEIRLPLTSLEDPEH